MKVELTIVIAVLESYEAVYRQCQYWANMPVPLDVEIIIMDDGSPKPLSAIVETFASACNVRVIGTGDTRPWSQPCARNAGAKCAKADYILFTDIDHIISVEALVTARMFSGDMMKFPREFAVIDEKGNLTQDLCTLKKYGLRRKIKTGPHFNTFVIKKELFEALNGYDESYCGKYGGDDTDFADRYSKLAKAGKATRSSLGPRMFVFPDPRKDVKQIFHGLRRKK